MAMDKTTSFQVMKTNNQQAVLHAIYHNENISRVEIAEKVGLTNQTITNIVNRLISEGIVVEAKELPLSPNTGRRPIPLRINSSQLYAVGIEVTRKYVRGVLMDFSHHIVEEVETILPEIENSEQVFQTILANIDSLLSKCKSPEQIKGIGVSVSGPIDQKSGVVLKAEHFHWVDFHLKNALEAQYPYPVYLENDVNIIAVAENATGVLEKSQNNITLLLDQGVGGAIVIDKKLYAGSKNAAGEFGNFKVPYSEESESGQYSAYVSLTTAASISALQKKLGIPFKAIIDRLEAGDVQVVKELRSVGDAIGYAVSNVVTMLNPDHVLLTGRLIEKAGYLLEPIIADKVKQMSYEYSRGVIIKSTVLMDGARMAAGLVAKEMFKEPALA